MLMIQPERWRARSGERTWYRMQIIYWSLCGINPIAL
jgi:hypothetical protein